MIKAEDLINARACHARTRYKGEWRPALLHGFAQEEDGPVAIIELDDGRMDHVLLCNLKLDTPTRELMEAVGGTP